VSVSGPSRSSTRHGAPGHQQARRSAVRAVAAQAEEPAVWISGRHLGSRENSNPRSSIDRPDTSGCSSSPDRPPRALKAQFEAREAERVYQPVYGHPSRPLARGAIGSWDDRIVLQKAVSSRPARSDAESRYTVVEQFEERAARSHAVSGKRNQIRLQAQLRGHPLVGGSATRPMPRARGNPFKRRRCTRGSSGFVTRQTAAR
jgi:hypothetical protein